MANHIWFGKKPFLTASMFSTMAFLDRYIRGKGGRWLSMAERTIERKRKQGIEGGRVFDETTHWADRDDNPNNDHKFFNVARSTSLRMWDYRQIGRVGSDPRPERLTFHHLKMLLHLIRLARKHDFKIELVADATLKHATFPDDARRIIGWKVIGHCIRQLNSTLRAIHANEWIDAEMAGPTPEATERVRKLFDSVAGAGLDELVGVEGHNEFGAHSRKAWISDGYDEAGMLAEVNKQIDRADSPEQWPAGAFWVSHGGRDTIDYDPGRGAACVALHPSRPSLEIGNRFKHLEEHGIPVYMNESLHGIDPSMWWTVERGWFRPKSSTKDSRARAEWLLGLLDRGYWACDHSLVGMASGYWYDGPPTQAGADDPDNFVEMELDGVEKILATELGTGTGSPKPPKPPKPTDPKPDPVVDPDPDPDAEPSELVEIETASPLWSLPVAKPNRVKIERSPELLHGIDDHTIIDERVTLHFKVAARIEGVRVFHGVDGGDIGEVATAIYVNGVPIVLRSDHFQAANDFDAWRAYKTDSPVTVGGGVIVTVDVVGRAAGGNARGLTRPGFNKQDWLIRPHWGIWFTLSPLG